MTQLQKDAYVVCGTGDIIPADGDIVEGIASADEAAITGKSAPSFANRAVIAGRSQAAGPSKHPAGAFDPAIPPISSVSQF